MHVECAWIRKHFRPNGGLWIEEPRHGSLLLGKLENLVFLIIPIRWKTRLLTTGIFELSICVAETYFVVIGGIVWLGTPDAKEILPALPPGSRKEINV